MMDDADRALLRDTVDTAIGDAWATTPTVEAVDGVLDRLGWREMLQAEPRAAIEIVFGALGTINATATALDDVLAAAVGAVPGPGLGVVLPLYAGWDPPGRLDADRVRVRGLATSRAAFAHTLLAVCVDGAGLRAAHVPAVVADIVPVHGIDPSGGWYLVELDVDAATSDASPLDPEAWTSTVGLGRRALARQLAGASHAMLNLARAHATERAQFGRPIAAFQAVRHRLADALVAVEALEASVDAAWDDPGPETAALAKAIAGRTADTVATHAQQVLAGVGFTTDHTFHSFLKRSLALGGVFGSADAIVVDLGRRLLAERHVPTLLEL